MKKITPLTTLIILTLTSLYGTNLDNIYGKNDLNLNGSRGDLYGNNFGSILDYDEMSPRHVDIATAQTEIDLLSDQISEYGEEVSRFQNIVQESSGKKNEISVVIEKIDLLLIELKSTSADLYAAKENQTDNAMRLKIQASVEENRQQIYDLSNKKSALLLQKEELERNITSYKRFVTLNNLFIRKNNNRISYLKSCIAYTGSETDSVDTLVEKSSSYQNKVDDLIKVSF